MCAQLASERFAVLKEIFQLAGEQRLALDADDIERFHQLLGEREALIARLVVVDESELPKNVIRFRGTRAEDADYDDETAISVVLRGILDQDAENELRIRTKIGEVQEAMQRIGRGIGVARRYKGYTDESVALDRFVG